MTAAKQLLSAHGTLIAAASNWFGVKYMAGAERETGALSWNEMKQLLPGGEFYYPMPDYRTAGDFQMPICRKRRSDRCVTGL